MQRFAGIGKEGKSGSQNLIQVGDCRNWGRKILAIHIVPNFVNLAT